jgi:hypothetical protein
MAALAELGKPFKYIGLCGDSMFAPLLPVMLICSELRGHAKHRLRVAYRYIGVL